MIRTLTVCCAALASVGCATAPAEHTAPRNFVVLEENVSIPYSTNSLSSFERVDADTYLFKVNGNRWYKAELMKNCGDGASNGFGIRVDTGRDPTNRIDTFTTLILDETHHCRIQKLDRIEPPAKT